MKGGREGGRKAGRDVPEVITPRKRFGSAGLAGDCDAAGAAIDGVFFCVGEGVEGGREEGRVMKE